MHTVQACCTEVSGEKENQQETYACGSLFIPPCKLSRTLYGRGQSDRLGKLPVVG